MPSRWSPAIPATWNWPGAWRVWPGRGRGAQLEAGLRALQERSPLVGDVRGIGLYWAVEIVADRGSRAMLPADARPTEALRNHALANGLMVYARPTSGGRYGHWVTIAPPLNTTEAECRDVLERLERSLAAYERVLRADGLIR